MAVNEATIIKACKSGDVTALMEMSKSKVKLSSKSRSKEYENIFQRALFESLGTLNENEVARILSDWAVNVSELLTEKQMVGLLARGKYEILDTLIRSGWNLGRKSIVKKYNSIFDRMFRESIIYGRVEEIVYLMNNFDIEYISQESVIRILTNEEDLISHINRKLEEKGSMTILNFLLGNGMSMEKIIEILN